MSYHKISVFFEMTEINGTVVCFDGVCPMCLKIVSLMRPIWEPRGVGFVPLQAEWVRRRLNLPEAELLGEMRVAHLARQSAWWRGCPRPLVEPSLVALATVVGD